VFVLWIYSEIKSYLSIYLSIYLKRGRWYGSAGSKRRVKKHESIGTETMLTHVTGVLGICLEHNVSISLSEALFL
jgi:hypothetical protein